MEGASGKVDQEQKKQKMMVAVDESECSHYALQWALQHLAHTIRDSQLIIFTVQPFLNLGLIEAASYGTTPPELIAPLQENQKKAALALLEKAKQDCAKYGVEAETITELGEPREAICGAVEKLDIQLLVLGSHSRGAIKRLELDGKVWDGTPLNFKKESASATILGTQTCIMKKRGKEATSMQIRVFLGSVSNYCVHNAKCPVLVVKKQA